MSAKDEELRDAARDLYAAEEEVLRATLEHGRGSRQWHEARLARHVARTVYTAARTEAERPEWERRDERDPNCVARWPGCESMEYDPRCCRFPKSCSAGTVRMVRIGEVDS